ncbi:Glutamate 5-kinase [Halomicronema hongdechloris C2206]|uniref:Glutamate 5-kinase n=1 Tax=Halomicronema hongdechloris C2206 TaxID=1641165 RepID=A0A1Z3HHB3_9CYAN|nr:glutamate 5-kinase [Halomicronema hongdechloris]ASC69653.1 Glutamate 5-kinase [Halomicronema hongdechloris C2206]
MATVPRPQTLVVKIGTSSLTQGKSGYLALSTIARLVETLSRLRQQDHRVILVSSGAMGVGCVRLGLSERPRTIAMKQAVAAVGQGRLMRVYDDLFSALSQPIAQVLLTRSDLEQRSRYVNSYRTFRQLTQLGIIPIVNENDTVAIEELKFGDNDTLSALVASLVGADWLFLLTDVDRLYSADPRHHADAHPIHQVDKLKQLEDLQIVVGDRGSQWGTGGMATKLEAARIATAAGIRMAITEGRHPENIEKILAGEPLGTQFAPHPRPNNARKRWIANSLVPTGRLYLDAGAVQAIRQGGKSLLAAGITQVTGEFQRRDAVQLCDVNGQEVARGIVNYDSQELHQIRGCRSDQIPEVLGYEGADTVVHRDNLALEPEAD